MKEVLQFLLGIVLFLLGIYLLLSNIQVGSIGFYYFGRLNTGAILIVLFVILVICAIVRTNILTVGLAALDLIGIVVSVIMGTRFYFRSMSAFDLVLMTGIFAVGLGLVAKSLLGVRK